MEPTADLDPLGLNIDWRRRERCGFPEVVYGQGKTLETLRGALRAFLERGEPPLVTRVDPEHGRRLAEEFPELAHNPVARTLRARPSSGHAAVGFVPIITAGTTDRPVAEEALETLGWMGVRALLVQDVGVAGPHRLPEKLGSLEGADAVVVVAGMEGALPSVVAGYLPCPVIAVPTSVGYGANFGGLSALLSMLNSCASNVAVVNIDAGFRGGYLAGLIATRRTAGGETPPS